MAAILEFYFRIWFWLISHRHATFHRLTNIHPNRTMHCTCHTDFSRWTPQSQKDTSGFWFSDGWHSFKTSKYICTPNFD